MPGYHLHLTPPTTPIAPWRRHNQPGRYSRPSTRSCACSSTDPSRSPTCSSPTSPTMHAITLKGWRGPPGLLQTGEREPLQPPQPSGQHRDVDQSDCRVRANLAQHHGELPHRAICKDLAHIEQILKDTDTKQVFASWGKNPNAQEPMKALLA